MFYDFQFYGWSHKLLSMRSSSQNIASTYHSTDRNLNLSIQLFSILFLLSINCYLCCINYHAEEEDAGATQMKNYHVILIWKERRIVIKLNGEDGEVEGMVHKRNGRMRD